MSMHLKVDLTEKNQERFVKTDALSTKYRSSLVEDKDQVPLMFNRSSSSLVPCGADVNNRGEKKII